MTFELSMNRSNAKSYWKSCIFLFIVFVFYVQGCATTKPQPVDPLAYKSRTKSSVSGDVTVTVAVPTIEEAQAIYGVKLAKKRIRPVWVEVNNQSNAPYWFLPSGLDPEYFSPSEAAFAFYKDQNKENRQLDDKFQKLRFQNPIWPGTNKNGFVLVNLDEGFKPVDIDLISHGKVESFSFIITDPNFKGDYTEVDSKSLYSDEDIIDIEDEEENCAGCLKSFPAAPPMRMGINTATPSI